MIFNGPTFYQRLIHMAEDKRKIRTAAPPTLLLGRVGKRYDGVKFGEMEGDCLLAHGVSVNLYERLFALSDLSQMHICSRCSNSASVILRQVPRGGKIRRPYFRHYQSAESVVQANVPYGDKLLCQEHFSMGICGSILGLELIEIINASSVNSH